MFLKRIWFCAACVLAMVTAVQSQQSCSGCAPSSSAEGQRVTGSAPGFDNRPFPQTDAAAATGRANDKWAQIQRDTEKLAQLSRELQAAVDKTDKGKLSMDVIRKADEIERLSKSIRERMKSN